MKYVVKFNAKHSELDSYEHGCDPESSVMSDCDITLRAYTLEALVTVICRFFNVEKNALQFNSCDEVGRLDVQTMTKSLGAVRDSYSKHKVSFEAGDCDLWLHNFIGEVTTVPQVVDLSQLG